MTFKEALCQVTAYVIPRPLLSDWVMAPRRQGRFLCGVAPIRFQNAAPKTRQSMANAYGENGPRFAPQSVEDSLSFKLDRFLNPDWNRVVSFSSGARYCLGWKFFSTEGITVLISRSKTVSKKSHSSRIRIRAEEGKGDGEYLFLDIDSCEALLVFTQR
ncbi:hypothetical protein P691DRAFT_809361 [Macrolepiota fuliginosa MF-IS2]|uniref:Cytochrome P450 n=1 Tax=Macrolepiota fuliginosa MF-IS2 TaxID=1400762 RepID=A0A9P5XHJ4_9AGAR|nr:hypothetical protein P691DRAFT_809361 [Macrolepiota fuliginosa MF-IS2]